MKLTIEKLNLDSFAINEGNRTVAYVTPQGYIDWLLISPDDEGRLITKLEVETHLSHTLGLKMVLHTAAPSGENRHTRIAHEILEDGTKVRLVGESSDVAGQWKIDCEAVLSLNPATRRFEWAFQTAMTCVAAAPVLLGGVEFNNVYPGRAGRCMLFEPGKEFDKTIMVDKEGAVWKFPHQHALHYTVKIRDLKFAEGTMGGFFGSKMNPVVIVEKSTMPQLDWGICDMYYDLHCCARCEEPVAPGTTHRWTYTIKYLDEKEAAVFERKAKAVPITAEDYRHYDIPRLGLGRNEFKNPLGIDRPDDGSYFRGFNAAKAWDKRGGPDGMGALTITNEEAQETVWSAEPPTVVPTGTTLRITARVKTEGVEGKGMFIRVRPHRFHWRPEPHVEWTAPLESVPVTGTTQGWVEVNVPEMVTPKEIVDRLVWIDVILDGKGKARLSDVNVELK